jgi:hypothetical protein
VALLLSRSQDLAGTTEEELRHSLGLPDLQSPEVQSPEVRSWGRPWRAILECVIDERPQADRILVAQLHGEAIHHARWHELSGDEEATALAALA